jgi:hypothetical protein
LSIHFSNVVAANNIYLGVPFPIRIADGNDPARRSDAPVANMLDGIRVRMFIAGGIAARL